MIIGATDVEFEFIHGASRRRFLIQGATSLAFASFVAKAHGMPPQQQSAGISGTTTLGSTMSSVTTVTDVAQRLTINVRIDGQGPYRFLVDTGADRTVVATEVAADLGLIAGERVMLEGVVRAVAAETVSVRELSFGSVRCRDLVVPILPASMLEADGYLGLDVLDNHRVTLDFKNHTLQVGDSRSRLSTFWVRPKETRIRATGSSGHLRAVNCTVDGISATAFVDTGGELSAGNSALLTALVNRDPRYKAIGTILLSGVTGGAITGSAAPIQKIQLRELEITDCTLVIADFQVFNVWGLREHPAVLIGMNFLRRFSKVSIDYGLKELRFDLAHLGLVSLQST